MICSVHQDGCPSKQACSQIGRCTDHRETVAEIPTILDPRNPKDIAGQLKPQLHLIPSGALVEVSKVMMNGAFKYDPYNWREKKVAVTAYISASERHARSFLDGEDYDPDAGRPHPTKGLPPCPVVHHLAADIAGKLILLDAILTGNAIDDRPKPGVAGKLINPPKDAHPMNGEVT